ncbi:MAG: 30S ribosomal protein S9 [Deltaproteobacteria bacterium]|nr:30S ribosomal protein S9 [Deltaproteobacteria bacterium]
MNEGARAAAQVPESGRWQAVGRRKSAVARVWIQPGTGRIIINKRTLEDYFDSVKPKAIVMQPLDITGLSDKLDILVNVRGGGTTGQADAIRHGISRSLIAMDPEHRTLLKRLGFLRRDARVKERKKYGLRGARARFQFSKR